MEKIRLGRTNLFVTRLGWGGIPIQRVSEEEAISVVRAVVEMGVELLDTARGYTNSEARIGQALQTTDREVILSTKSQVQTDRIGEDVLTSLREMNVKKIHIYHLHNVSNQKVYEKAMGPGGAYEGLMRMRDRGRVDFIGITSHSLDVLARAVEEGHFDVIMVCYSFLEPDAERKLFPRARAKDIGMISMKPFSGGVIEDPGPALRFVLAQPDVVPIPGSETLEKARANWEVFVQDHTLTRRDRETIANLKQEMDRQFCRRCDYCQPCPEKISIQHILGLKYILKRFGPQAEELDWFHSLIQKARNCTECGDCSERCPYQLPIPELIRKNLAWYDEAR